MDHPAGGRVGSGVGIVASTRIPCVVQVASITPPQWSIISALLTVKRALDNPDEYDLDIPLGELVVEAAKEVASTFVIQSVLNEGPLLAVRLRYRRDGDRSLRSLRRTKSGRRNHFG